MEKYKVLIHINESNKWGAALANVNNLIKDLGNEDIIIEVVANGVAVVDYVSSSEYVNKMKGLSNLGVSFIACKNSLIGNKIEENLLPDFVTNVPAGITELIKKQAEGYAYIKP